MSRNKVVWIQCEKCSTNIVDKNIELHSNDCPPNKKDIRYGFIKDRILYGRTDIKTNTESISDKLDADCLVFLSESTIQLCGLVIGNWVLLRPLDDDSKPPVTRIVWPTLDKTLTSILLTEEGSDTSFKSKSAISIQSFTTNLKKAKTISVVLLNGPKGFDITNEFTNRLCQKHIGRPITQGNRLHILFYGKNFKFEIKTIETDIDDDIINELGKLELSECFYEPDESTRWTIYRNEEAYEETQEAATHLLTKIGGLQDEISKIKGRMQICLQPSSKSIFIGNTHSLLLYGSSGTGKTLLAKAIAEDSRANVTTISPSELDSSGSSNVTSVINKLFDEAMENQPSVIIIDSIDVLCPARSSRLTDYDRKVSSTLLKNLDNLSKKTRAKVFVIATSNKPDSIDADFRRYGILDREIEIPVPNPKARKEILMKLLNNAKYDIDDDSLTEIALNMHGFVGADLASLCSEAATIAFERNGNSITAEDFKSALKFVKPSAMREVQIEVPNVKWFDIGGQESLKLILKQAVEWPLKYPESFIRLGTSPPRGVLMYGPPGCSKTMIAKALATESGLNFLSIKGPELFSKWVGESERAVREVFRKARQVSPSIIFFDEIDALGGERTSGSSSTSVQERVLAQLLTELDGVTPLGNVTVVAATNRPDRIDNALLRPGRLDRIVYVPLPDAHTRKDILRIKLSKMAVSDVNLEELVKLTELYSGAEINAVCDEASMMALTENLEAQFVENRHFVEALRIITPRTPSNLIKLYENYQKI